jgi:hypothetical protein
MTMYASASFSRHALADIVYILALFCRHHDIHSACRITCAPESVASGRAHSSALHSIVLNCAFWVAMAVAPDTVLVLIMDAYTHNALLSAFAEYLQAQSLMLILGRGRNRGRDAPGPAQEEPPPSRLYH